MRALLRLLLLLPAILFAFVLIPAIVFSASGAVLSDGLPVWFASAAAIDTESLTAFQSADPTPVPPTETPTIAPPPTNTPIDTPTATPPPDTPTATPTLSSTSLPPTNTPTATPTIGSTALPPTNTPTNTPPVTPTNTPPPQPTSPLPTVVPPTPHPTAPPRPPAPQPTTSRAPSQVSIYPHTIKKVIGDRLSPTIYAYASNRALYRSNQNGRIWAMVNPAPRVDDFVMSSADPNVLYSGAGVACDDPLATNAPFFRSLDGGVTWVEIPTAINLRPLLIDPANPYRLFAADCTMLYISTDGGLSWQERPDNSADQLWSTYRVVAMAAAALVGDPKPAQPHWDQIYAVGVNADGEGVVAFSGDQGETWVTIVDAADLLLAPNLIVAHQTQAGLSWVVTGQGVWTTADFGINWGLLDRGLRNVISLDANGLNALTNGLTGNLYLATVRGLYMLEAGSDQWTMVSGTTFANLNVTGLLLTESNPTLLWINTLNNGVYGYRIPAK